jgi:hypothetical protein
MSTAVENALARARGDALINVTVSNSNQAVLPSSQNAPFSPRLSNTC